MHNTLRVIQNLDDRVIQLSYLGLVVLGNLINDWYFFIGLILLATIISIIRFVHDKKWLADADKYIRIVEVKPFWKKVVKWGIAIASGLIYAYLFSQIERYIHDKTNLAMLIGVFILLLGNQHHNFIHSIKSFEEGIQFPGRNQEVIPWKEIYDFKLNEKIYLSTSKGEHEFDIHEDDPEHAEAMIDDWKQKKGRSIFK